MGQGESLAVADIKGDSALEVLYGTTTLAMSAEQIAAWVNGHLTPVATANGEPIVLLNGYPQPSNRTRYKEWGCTPEGHLVQTTSDLDRGFYRSVSWSIDGAEARVIAQERHQLPAGTPTSGPDIVDDCPSRDSSLTLVEDPQAPVAPDLERLAKQFVSYALGDSDTFPHWESVSLGLGGQVMLSIDDLAAALANRRIWRICPSDWEGYGASSCPVNLLGPILHANVNDHRVVYSAAYSNVTCAPDRVGPVPQGRLIVLRPSDKLRTCASDFALVLVADDEGQMLSIDLTLSAP